MRIAIAGAGKAGRSIARQLVKESHDVLLIDRDPSQIRPPSVPEAEWLLADVCEIGSLSEAHLEGCDVAVAATGDDKVNLVHALLAKTEFGVPRVVARVNHPNNEWLFNQSWGVDVAVSAPALMGAVVGEAVSTGDLVRLFTSENRETALVGVKLPESSPWIGRALDDLDPPEGAAVTAVVRQGQPIAPAQAGELEAADELIVIVARHAEAALADALAGQGQDLRPVRGRTRG
ncbi:MAG: TrkA family potassium uptake protein [Propionibacteriaceae bacterium]|jgi:trk system potassium uptake protein TrkA|nr:TrkA family potassium uptake protein [Propionibacteriaceae bacterium]